MWGLWQILESLYEVGKIAKVVVGNIARVVGNIHAFSYMKDFIRKLFMKLPKIEKNKKVFICKI